MINALGTIATVMAAAASPMPTPDFARNSNYNSSNLIEDILKPILAKKFPEPTNDMGEKIANLKIDTIVSEFRMQKNSGLADNLFNKWSEIFNTNPSINTLDELLKQITPEIDKWIAGANSGDIHEYFTKTIFPFIDGKIDDILTTASTNKLIDWNTIQSQIDLKIKSVLDTFKLDGSERNDGVSELNALSANAESYLENIVQNANPLVVGEPYLDIDSTKISDELEQQIEKDYRKEDMLDKLAKASLEKAKAGLAGIESDIFSKSISDRRFNILNSLPNQAEPWNLYNAVFDKNNSKLKDWFDKWKDIIDVNETIEKSVDNFKIRFDLSIKDDFIAIPKNTADPTSLDLKLKKADVNPESFKTGNIKIINFEYSTDKLKTKVEQITKLLNEHGTVLEKEFAKLKLTYPGLTGVSLDDMLTLIPTEFGKLKNLITTLKIEYDKAQWGGTSGNSKLEISFDIKEITENGEDYLEIVPKIKDEGIDHLTSIKMTSPQFDTATIKTIENIVKDFDKDHIEEDVPLFKVQLTSELSNVVSRIYNFFETNPPKNKSIYRSQFNGLSIGDAFIQANLEEAYTDKNLLQDFLKGIAQKYGTRFVVTYTVDSISDSEITISYKVKDTSDNKIATQTLSGKDLDNIHIRFSEHKSLYDKYKADLKGLGIMQYSSFDTKDHAMAFDGKTLPQAEVPKIVDDIEKLIDDASKEAEPILISTNGEMKWNTSGNVLQMEFTLSHKVNGVDVEENIWKTISGSFADKSFIADKLKAVEDMKDSTVGSIKQIGLPNSEESILTAGIAMAADTFKDQILKDPGITLEKIKEFEDTFNKMAGGVLRQAGQFKKDMIHDLISKTMNGHIPQGIEDLFNQYADKFMDIIKNHPELLKNPEELKKFLELVKDMNVADFLNATKTMEKDTKIAIAALGGILGLGGALGAANALKIGTTNKKLSKLSGRGKNIKIKSSKKLAFMSGLIGIISIAGSVGTFLYLFIAQGGF